MEDEMNQDGVRDFGIEASPAASDKEAHVFVVFHDWAENGPTVQSQPLSMIEVDFLIDDLIEAQRVAKDLLLNYGRETN